MSNMRRLGFWSLIGIGIGSIIGGSVFVTAGRAVEIAEAWAILSYLLCATIAILTGITYAELVKKHPEAGGSYAFVKSRFSPLISEAFGKILTAGYLAALTLYALSFGVYVSKLVPLDPRIWGTCLLVLVGAINYAGARETGAVEIVLVALKVGILVLLAVIAVFTLGLKLDFSGDPLLALLPVGFIFVGFEGFEIVANAAEEAEIKDVEKAIIFSVWG